MWIRWFKMQVVFYCTIFVSKFMWNEPKFFIRSVNLCRRRYIMCHSILLRTQTRFTLNTRDVQKRWVEKISSANRVHVNIFDPLLYRLIWCLRAFRVCVCVCSVSIRKRLIRCWLNMDVFFEPLTFLSDTNHIMQPKLIGFNNKFDGFVVAVAQTVFTKSSSTTTITITVYRIITICWWCLF